MAEKADFQVMAKIVVNFVWVELELQNEVKFARFCKIKPGDKHSACFLVGLTKVFFVFKTIK